MAYNFAKTEVGFSHEIDSRFTYPRAFLVSSYCIIHDFQFGLMSLKCKIFSSKYLGQPIIQQEISYLIIVQIIFAYLYHHRLEFNTY